MAHRISKDIASSEEMVSLGADMAQSIQGIERIYFSGDLGAGKTTLIRGMLQGLGHTGAVKSPTFSLLEPYPGLQPPVYHFDLYRLQKAEELEYLGWREYFLEQNLCLLEWPSRATGILPIPDLNVIIRKTGEGRVVQLEPVQQQAIAMLDTLP
ncbi:MAG: tRNA (adenosine(37)-N6)-threonylcarbamoyltransferase complex ATPase subunit type 1 TsaE [Gammaproteobacteria bacterium]|nr:MAG: tRNA (adenosine(37)-N6)-threonylcarbamoyltransferase complex ATPase subunit type 1 TsaE [Gammaproteobacteria bacterium]